MITHENAKPKDMDDYFQKKFHPLLPIFLIGRSYTMEPKCDPKHTLFDLWKELVCPSLVILRSSLFRTVLVFPFFVNFPGPCRFPWKTKSLRILHFSDKGKNDAPRGYFSQPGLRVCKNKASIFRPRFRGRATIFDRKCVRKTADVFSRWFGFSACLAQLLSV